MRTVLFHKDLDPGIPAHMMAPAYTGRLDYSFHAREAAGNDRYGFIPLPESFTGEGAELIEVEFNLDRGRISKQVWRQPLDESRDLVLVVKPDGFVKTVWVNMKDDEHPTLNPENYGYSWRRGNKHRSR